MIHDEPTIRRPWYVDFERAYRCAPHLSGAGKPEYCAYCQEHR